MLDLLVALFYLPTQHLPEYSRLLLKLATCFEVVGLVVSSNLTNPRFQKPSVMG